MKLKKLVAALGLLAALPAFAAIDPPATTGAELFLVVWEQGAAGRPDQSFTFDTGVTYASFIAGVNTSQIWADITAANTEFSGFLASSDLASLQYAVLGGKSPGFGSLITTVHVGDEAQVALNQNGQVTSALANITSYLADVNITGNHGTVTNGQSVNLSGTVAYFQDPTHLLADFNGGFVSGPFGNSNLIGQASEFTSLTRVAGLGSRVASELVLPGVVNFAQVGGDYILSYTVAAVPEGSGLGMALAGVGVAGFIGRRRKQA